MPNTTANPPFSHAADPSRPLAHRLGIQMHLSPLRMRLRRLMTLHPIPTASSLDDWLLDLAHARGAIFVAREGVPADRGPIPPVPEVTNEELVVALCQPHNPDRPVQLRAAAELISRRLVQPDKLLRLARMELADRVLAELARQARRVEPAHPVWSVLAHQLADAPPLRSPLLHWSRLAVPTPENRGIRLGPTWKLIQ